MTDQTRTPGAALSPPSSHGPEVDWEQWLRGRKARKQVAITLPPDLVMWAKANLNLSRWVEHALRSAQEGLPATLTDLRARAERERARLAATEARIAEYELVASLSSLKETPDAHSEEP